MVEGWILLHRKLQECEIWDNSQPFDMRSAWIDLLLLANHRDVEMVFDYEPMTVKRGQYLTSVRKLGARWSWSKNRTLKFLKLLESLNMITRDSTNQRTLVTIVKYDVYQDMRDTSVDTTKDTGMDAVVDAGMPQTNNVKNEKNIYNVCFEEFWNHYPRKKEKANAYKKYLARCKAGRSEQELLEACLNYEVECKATKREERYIKLAATFLSESEPFVDYLNQNYKPTQAASAASKTKGTKFSEGIIKHGVYDFAELENTAFGTSE